EDFCLIWPNCRFASGGTGSETSWSGLHSSARLPGAVADRLTQPRIPLPPKTFSRVLPFAAMIFALDLEGVLAPEIWPALGTQFNVPEFALTTRDVADFSELMRKRVDAAARASLTLADLQKVAHAVQPYLGAREFMDRLQPLGNVVIISDT